MVSVSGKHCKMFSLKDFDSLPSTIPAANSLLISHHPQ
jgi:hypothetical protein